jgi:hypothetical protein
VGVSAFLDWVTMVDWSLLEYFVREVEAAALVLLVRHQP